MLTKLKLSALDINSCFEKIIAERNSRKNGGVYECWGASGLVD